MKFTILGWALGIALGAVTLPHANAADQIRLECWSVIPIEQPDSDFQFAAFELKLLSGQLSLVLPGSPPRGYAVEERFNDVTGTRKYVGPEVTFAIPARRDADLALTAYFRLTHTSELRARAAASINPAFYEMFVEKTAHNAREHMRFVELRCR